MSSSTKDSALSNVIIDIPPEYVEDGKTLLIEKMSELFVDGCHISKPPHFIRQNHGLCLVDTQQQDLRSVKSNHQLESTIDDNQLVQIIIQFPTVNFDAEISVTIEKMDSDGKQELSGNFQDLFNIQHSNKSTEAKNIRIQISKESLQRGKTILIQKDHNSVTNNDKQQTHHLNQNQFARRDHLQSNNLMEITIEIPPEILLNGQTITFRREDPQLVAANFQYHRNSKPHINA